jgi:phosphonate degradation associated HDIG domain protein
MAPVGIVAEIVDLFAQKGSSNYGGEAVSQLEHALQTAAQARQAGASSAVVCAALLHDVGHLVEDETDASRDPGLLDDRHEEKGSRWLNHHFGAEISDPVRLHVAAKRYLCTVDAEYLDCLSPASLQSFREQGGKMSAEEIAAFESEPNQDTAVLVRKWDDSGKTPGRTTPAIAEFVPDLATVVAGQ